MARGGNALVVWAHGIPNGVRRHEMEVILSRTGRTLGKDSREKRNCNLLKDYTR